MCIPWCCESSTRWFKVRHCVHTCTDSLPCREILTTIGRKYDQYLDFRQQDAHEFLRHMLDAMRMEELDVSTAYVRFSGCAPSFLDNSAASLAWSQPVMPASV